MRRFFLQRMKDVSGVSGCGRVAEGCQFDNGWCALVWLTSNKDCDEVHAYYRNIERVVAIHGHDGATKVVWLDHEEKKADSPWAPTPGFEKPGNPQVRW